jgi:phosphoserine phosphatase RsbU/P
MSSNVSTGWLVPLSGPSLHSFELKQKSEGLVIGRHEKCDVRLASDSVSRFHARCDFIAGQWRITDLTSRWGTFINGQRITKDTHIPLQPGDLIGISPWTFNFRTEAAVDQGMASMNDLARNQTLVRAVLPHRSGVLAEDRLAVLLEVAAAMQNVTSEPQLAEVLVDAARKGSGMHHAAVLRPIDARERIEVVSAHLARKDQPVYSRSLINAASNGVVAAFVPDSEGSASQSIEALKIDAALCVPLMLGRTVASFLYLDSRGGKSNPSVQQWNSISAFCLALGRIGSLALANLKRVDVERRAAQVETEIKAAAEIQQWILPQREFEIPPFRCCGESRPGRLISGDFFDLFPLPDGQLVILVGDVSGKGVAASVLMTCAHGFLHAAIKRHGWADLAVTQLAEFLSPRQPGDRFLTLWIGVLNPTTRTLSYVDAGHGYAFLKQSGNDLLRLNAGENLPIGAGGALTYAAVTINLAEHGALLLVSDGIIEQPSPMSDGLGERVEFGVDGLRSLIDQMIDPAPSLSIVFEAVAKYADSANLADDATAVRLLW